QSLGNLSPGRILAGYRNEPFWMRPATGRCAADVPLETQFLFVEMPDQRIALFVPLVDGPMRGALQGQGDQLILVAETGTPAQTSSAITALYVDVGHDLEALCTAAAHAIAKKLNTTTRQQKSLPAFIDDFGW